MLEVSGVVWLQFGPNFDLGKVDVWSNSCSGKNDFLPKFTFQIAFGQLPRPVARLHLSH